MLGPNYCWVPDISDSVDRRSCSGALTKLEMLGPTYCDLFAKLI